MFNKGKTIERQPSGTAVVSDKSDMKEKVLELQNALQDKCDEVDRLQVKIELLRSSLSQVRRRPSAKGIHLPVTAILQACEENTRFSRQIENYEDMEQFFVRTVKDVIFDLGVSFRSLKSKAEDVEHTLHSMFGPRYPVEYQDDKPADDPFSGYKSMSQSVNWGIFDELAKAAESGELLEEPVTPSAKEAITESSNQTAQPSDPEPSPSKDAPQEASQPDEHAAAPTEQKEETAPTTGACAHDLPQPRAATDSLDAAEPPAAPLAAAPDAAPHAHADAPEPQHPPPPEEKPATVRIQCDQRRLPPSLRSLRAGVLDTHHVFALPVSPYENRGWAAPGRSLPPSPFQLGKGRADP